MTTQRPFSQACENNKDFILHILEQVVMPGQSILEIGSGTAQHALHFAHNLPDITWQPAEIRANMDTLRAGLSDHHLDNLRPPLLAEAGYQWPAQSFDGVFSANCLHIMAAGSVEEFFRAMPGLVKSKGFLCVYGPFRYGGEFTTASNARFDMWLKDRDPRSGVRDFEWVDGLAEEAGFTLVADHAMPANNQFIHWLRTGPIRI